MQKLICIEDILFLPIKPNNFRSRGDSRRLTSECASRKGFIRL